MRKPACCEVAFASLPKKYYICENQFFMRKIFRNILKGISVTSALFVFQACYGGPMPPEDLMYDGDKTKAVVEDFEEVEETVDLESPADVENAE